MSKEFRGANPNTWHKACPVHMNLTYLYIKKIGISLYMNWRNLQNYKKKIQKVQFHKCWRITLWNVMEWETIQFDRFVILNY